ncbi:MAG TPA: pilus (MSHA type) biogenesis protein MshL [Steroidobacteraceae bacterium]|nr:pilus (MSHA type) biogenesis protein MshL [Steroidobacteraceae bacterium]
MMYARILFFMALLCMGFVPPARGDEPRFDVAVADAPARTFFEGLADGTPYNIVLEPGVGGSVTLRMKNVTLVEVLDAVRDAYGYDYRRISSGFVIVPPALQTRLFQVNYIDLERRGTSRTRVSSGQVGQSSNPQIIGGSVQGMGGDGQSQGLSEPPGAVFSSAPGAKQQERVKEITGTSVSTRSSSDFWPELEASLRALVGTEGGRTVVMNAESGLIAVRATPRELRDVQQFLDKVQQIATRQVIIEAKIIEVTLSNAFQAGINWAAIAKNGASTYSAFQTGPQNGFGSNNLQLLNQPSVPVTIGPGNPITSAVSNTLGGAFAVAVNAGSFSSYVEALATQGKTTVLSSPRVSTLNNQKAVIKAGDDEYFVTGIESNTVTGTAASTSNNLDLAPFFSGVALDVTPQLSYDGQIILHIHPTVSVVTSKILTVTVAGAANGTTSLPLAFSEVRESDSVVKAMSGQLIVIGGLMQTTHSYQDYRVPLLGDIPVVGNLFKSQQKITNHTELVILLRPIVVDNDSQWAQLAGEEVDHAAKLDPKVRESAQ